MSCSSRTPRPRSFSGASASSPPEPEEELVKYVVAELGDENLVLSTDWPHDDSRFPHAIDGFLGHAAYFSADSKRKVLWDNCARLYKL